MSTPQSHEVQFLNNWPDCCEILVSAYMITSTVPCCLATTAGTTNSCSLAYTCTSVYTSPSFVESTVFTSYNLYHHISLVKNMSQ